MRGHWETENCIHYVPDVTMREDESRIRRESLHQKICLPETLCYEFVALASQKSQHEGKNTRCQLG